MRKLALLLALVLCSAAFAAVALASGANPSFSFSSDEPGATFTCALDSGAAAACSSPQAYSNLSPGQHTVTITSTFTVPNPIPKPVAAFTITPSPVIAGQPATFDAASSTCASPCSYKWTDPDDGQVFSTAESFSYTFNSTSVHHMALAITDGTGQTASTTQAFTPQAAPPPPPSGGPNCAPSSASQTMTNTVSHQCGFADTTNTGVPAGTTLFQVPQQITGPTAQTGQGWTYSNGSITLAPGGVLTNVKFTGVVYLKGSNETVQDSDLTDSGANSYTISLVHAPGATVVSNNIHGTGTAAPGGCDSAVRDIYADSDNLTVKFNNVWFCSNPLNNIADGGLIEQNYFHDFGDTGTGPHYEAMQFEQGNGTLMTVQDNTVLQSHSQTAAIILSDDSPSGVENNRVINHNLLAGGGYTFYGAGKSSTPSTNITFTNNDFSRLYFPQAGYYGPVAYWTVGNGNVWSGNIWDDTGASVGS